MSKQTARATLREQRRRLTRHQQRQAGRSLARLLARQLFFVRAASVAFYLPNDGEIDPWYLLEQAAAAGKRTYLPLLDPTRPGQLCFLPWRPGERLVTNRFGIPEPEFKPGVKARPWTLDLVCLPLVGFDPRGNRLGMGGGFYDRTFAGRGNRPHSRPLLVGLAHHFQQVDALNPDPWDVPLHAIATDRAVIHTNTTTATIEP